MNHVPLYITYQIQPTILCKPSQVKKVCVKSSQLSQFFTSLQSRKVTHLKIRSPNAICKSLILPETIAKLLHLTYLDISDTRCCYLPPELAQLNLSTFIFSFNYLKPKVFLDTICSAKTLTKLDLSNTFLKKLTNAIANLKELRILHLQHNLLRTLPAGLLKLAYLTELDISDNLIKNLPKELYLKQSLKIIICSPDIDTPPNQQKENLLHLKVKLIRRAIQIQF